MINAIDREYRITRLSKSNLADLNRLYTAVYGKSVADEYFNRKYDTTYTGVDSVGYIAYNNDRRPIAFYGVIPCFIQYGDTKMLAAQSTDTMTDPQHRYKGMFVELSNRTFDLCRQLGIRLIFGFPNQNSYHGAVNKLGWKMTGNLVCFIIPVKSFPLERLAKKLKFLQPVYNRYAEKVLKGKSLPLDGIANSVITDGFAGICRSPEYIGYRQYSTTRVLGIGGARIWVNHNYGLAIGDMEGVNEYTIGAVLRGLRKLAKRLGLAQVQFHCSPGTRLYHLMEQYYPAQPSYPVLFQDFGAAIPPEKIRFVFADIDIF